MEEIKFYFCGHEKCTSSHSFGPAIRTQFLIHFVLNGKGTFTRNNTVYHLKKGQYFLIAPDEITYYEADSSNPWEYAWISFGGHRANDILSQLNLHSTPIGTIKDERELSERVFELLKTYETAPQNILEQLKCVYGIFALMIPDSTVIDSACAESYVKQAEKFIRYNYAFDIKIYDIANHIGIDRTYLFKLFTNKYKISPKKYLSEYRLNNSCRLLSETDMNVSEIALSCGFGDSSSFCRQFKNKYELTPKEYRQLNFINKIKRLTL